MAVFVPQFPGSWTVDSNINLTNILASGSTVSAAYDNNLYNYSIISITATAGGLKVYVLSDINGSGTYQSVSDGPWGFLTVGGNTIFTISTEDYRKFQIQISNPTGSSVTATLRIQQVQIVQN